MPSATLPDPRMAQSMLLSVGTVCQVLDSKTGESYAATVISRRTGSSSTIPARSSEIDNVQYYIHRHDQDKRMDGWVDHTSLLPPPPSSTAASNESPTPIKDLDGSASAARTSLPHTVDKGKRKAEHDLALDGSDGSRTPSISRQASPALHDRAAGGPRARHKTRASSPSDTPAMRNIDRVLYGNYDIKTWYYSPYPLDLDEDAVEGSAIHSASSHAAANLASSKRTHSPATKRVPRRDSGSSLGGALSTSVRDAPAIKSLAASDIITSASGRHSLVSTPPNMMRARKDLAPTKMLWICDGCLKYIKTYNAFSSHRKFCPHTHPPGRKVYQRGAHIIWEVDGATSKLYCQNLSLFGKLFIDHKTIYFDVEPFLFYVLTDAANSAFDHPLGFFSKEKISYDDYNLACIVTFPPFQRKSFGTLMIEFSYYLSARQGMMGTPERPLSDLGFKGYLSFWTAVLLRALTCCFDGPLRPVNAASTARQRRPSSPVKPVDGGPSTEESGSDSKLNAEDALRQWQILTQRCRLLGVSMDTISHQAGFAELQQLAAEAGSNAIATSGPGLGSHRRKLRLKGWAGSAPTRTQDQLSGPGAEAAMDGQGASRRSSRVTLNGSLASAAQADSSIHPALNLSMLREKQGAPCTLAVTVDSLSRLTHLRPDDIVLALREAGLLDAPNVPFLDPNDDAILLNGTSITDTSDPRANGKNPNHLALLLTRDALREAIVRFNVRPAVLDESYALI